MKIFNLISTLILGTSLCLANSADVNKTGKSTPSKTNDKIMALSFAWWDLPSDKAEEIPDLYIQSGNEYVPVSPRYMAMSPIVNIRKTDTLDILRKTSTKESQEKPKESYEVYASIKLSVVNSEELGVIIIPNRQKKIAGTRIFDFSERGFPFGSFLVVNFTRSKIICSINESKFSISPNSVSRSPLVFTDRTIASIGLTAITGQNQEVQIVSTKAIFADSIRNIYFVTGKSDEESREFSIKTIIDFDNRPKDGKEPSKGTSDSKLTKPNTKYQ